jgi:hypothetical protein
MTLQLKRFLNRVVNTPFYHLRIDRKIIFFRLRIYENNVVNGFRGGSQQKAGELSSVKQL